MERYFGDSIANLQKKVEDLAGVSQANCFPTVLVSAILTPVIVWVILYFLQPNFVRRQEGNASLQDNSKVLVYTIIITAIIYAVGFGVSYFAGYDITSALCLIK